MRAIILTLICAWVGIASNALAQPTNSAASRPQGPTQAGWFTTVDGAFVHQFKTPFADSAGEFYVNRFAMRGGVGYQPDFTKSVSLSVGYDRDDYGFSGATGLSAGAPWGDVNTLRLGTPVRWGLDDRWTVFVIPTLRWSAEDGADWGSALSGGGFAGFSYRFGDRLTVGPGFGALNQLEDSPSFFPVLIIKWNVTEDLLLETGRSLGASQGPGLMLSYELTENWKFSLGSRYENFRFRLDQDGTTPSGVGEEKGVPLYLGVSYSWSRNGTVSLLSGVKVGGKLTLEDSSGTKLAGSDYDVAPFVGAAFSLRF